MTRQYQRPTELRAMRGDWVGATTYTKWLRAGVALCSAVTLLQPSVQARVVITEPVGSSASKDGHQFAPDSIPLPSASVEKSIPTSKLTASAPKRVSPQIQLGLQRLHGLQGPQDLKQAGQNFMLAYMRGDPQAPAAVAFCTMMGCYGIPDRRSVALWVERARQREPAKAKLLAWADADQSSDTQLRAQATKLLREAVALQDPVALNEQGLQQVTSGQKAAAFKSFEMAAMRGSSAGARNFNLLLQHTDENMRPRSAANAPSASAAPPPVPGQSLYEQAKRYHLGKDVPANDVQAIELYRQAANQGHQQSKRLLELIFLKLDAKGSPDPLWMRLIAQQHLSTIAQEIKPAAIWLQKDISLLADWLPLD